MMKHKILFLLFFIVGSMLAGTNIFGQDKKIPLSQDKPVYTCPMHPEVTKEKPGKCPKCGMQLEKRKESERAIPKDHTKMKRDMADTSKIKHKPMHKDTTHLDEKTIPDSLKKMMDK